MAQLKVSEALRKKLQKIGKEMGDGHVSVGFMGEGTYEDGTPIAAVAFWNEFGVPENNQPPRPYFRGMITRESPSWPKKIASLAKLTDYDGEKVLKIMGDDISGALDQSVRTLTDPPLSPNTHKKSAKAGFDKPLIDTGQMVRSITYKVEK